MIGHNSLSRLEAEVVVLDAARRSRRYVHPLTPSAGRPTDWNPRLRKRSGRRSLQMPTQGHTGLALIEGGRLWL